MCNQDRGTPKRISKENDMITLTLVSGGIEGLQEFMDASPLECMICARACVVIRVVHHRSENLIYQGHAINFLQEFSGFLRSGCIP